MVKKLSRPVVAVVFAIASVVVAPAALAWRFRAELLEAAGAACLAVFVAAHLHRGGWLVAAVALVAKGAEMDRRARP